MRDASALLLTNPDMLHASVLPGLRGSPGWRAWLRGLRCGLWMGGGVGFLVGLGVCITPCIVERTLIHPSILNPLCYTHNSYIVVDEAHHYRGALGCHVSLVLRRLLRAVAALQSDPEGSPAPAVVEGGAAAAAEAARRSGREEEEGEGGVGLLPRLILCSATISNARYVFPGWGSDLTLAGKAYEPD